MKRALAAAATFLMLAAACGDSGDAPATSRNLRIVMTDDWVTAPFTDAVREFERTHPGVQVDIDKGPIGKMEDVVRAGISSGSPPDLVQGHAHGGAGQELAEPVDDLWEKHGLTPGEYLPGAVEDVTWGGRRYGVPLDSNAMAIIYNAELFRAAGIPPPDGTMTFGDLERLAQAFTTPDGSRRGLSVSVDTWVTYGWIKANGGEIVRVGTDGRPRFTLNAPQVVDTLTYLTGLVDRGLAFGPGGPDARSSQAYALFRTGATAMYASGSWDLVKVLKEVPNGQFGVSLMPRGLTGTTQGTAMGGSSMWIPRGAAHRELAFEFSLLLTSDKYALRFAREEGRLPVRPRLFGDSYFQGPQLKVFVEQLATAHPPIIGALHEASQAFDQAVTEVLRDRVEPKTALDQAQARAAASVGPP